MIDIFALVISAANVSISCLVGHSCPTCFPSSTDEGSSLPKLPKMPCKALRITSSSPDSPGWELFVHQEARSQNVAIPLVFVAIIIYSC